MSQLRIYLDNTWFDAASLCTWALLDERGNLRESGTSNLAAMPHAEECVAIASADQVLSVAIRLPKIKARQLETALPYALEEHLLGEVTESHVVPGAKLPSGETLLFVINKDRLRRFVSACERASMRLRWVIPEYCLLPVRSGEWSVAWDGQAGFVATEQFAGATLGSGSEQQAPTALTLHLNQTTPAVLRIFYTSNIPEAQRVWPVWPDINFIRDAHDWDWRIAAIASDAPNLLWGKFAASARLMEWWPKLRPLLWLGVLVFLLQALGTNLLWWSLAREKDRIVHAMDRVYQETFGAESTVVDAALQMRRSLARARHAAGKSDDADFIPLLDRFAALAGGSSASKVTSARYAEGQLDVEIQLASRAAWDSLQRTLQEQGMQIQMIDLREGGNAVDVHLRVGVR
jgi:general secretion pathway protein L